MWNQSRYVSGCLWKSPVLPLQTHFQILVGLLRYVDVYWPEELTLFRTICVCQVRGTGNRLNHGDNDNRARLFNPLCAAILCVCVSRGHVRVDGMPQCYTETNQEVGNWSQDLRPCILHNTADFPSVNSFPNLDAACLLVFVF